jgi:hypothetical protein
VNNQKVVPYTRSLGDSSMILFVDYSILLLKDFELFYFGPNFFYILYILLIFSELTFSVAFCFH